MNPEQKTNTVSFTDAELHAIKTALGYLLTNPYNALQLERTLWACREKITAAINTLNEQ